MIVSLLPAAAFALDGDGTSDSPYLVGTEAELREAIASDNAYIQLTADIELQNHLEISKSVTIIGTNGTENRQINNKIVYVSGDGITVNFTNVDFSRTSGNCLLVVGRNMAQTAASSPTVVLEGCNISSTSSNTNGTVNFTGGSLTKTDSSVSGAPYGIILNGLLNNSPIVGDVSRTLVLTDTDVTSSAANGGKAIITNVGTKSGDTISVTGRHAFRLERVYVYGLRRADYADRRDD